MTTPDDLIEQMAFERLEPFPDGLTMQFAAGRICAVLANLKRDPKEHPEPWEPEDFMPELARSRGLTEQAKAPAKMLGEGLDAEAASALIDAAIFGIAPGSPSVH